MLLFKLSNIGGSDHIRHGTSGIAIGHDHRLCGESMAAVSAMKCTPQKTITSASVIRRFPAQLQ